MSQMTKAGGDASAELSLDDAFAILSNQRRRFTLHYLGRMEGKTTLSELAEHVAAWENEKPIEEVTSEERKRVYTALQQFHLSKMDEMGLLRFDSQTKTVELTSTRGGLEAPFDVLRRYDETWGRYYIWLSAGGVLLLIALWTGLYPLTLLGSLEWLTVLVTATAVLTAVRVVTGRRTRLAARDDPPERLR